MSAARKAADILALIQQNRLSPASARLKLWLKKEPEQPDAWHLMGVVHLHREAFADALKALTRADALQPGNPYVLNNQAVTLLRLGRPDDSAQAARKALAIADREPGFWANLGYAQQARRDFASMAEAFEQACRCAPGDAEFMVGWATALRQQGHYDNARALLDLVEAPDRAVELERLVLAVLSGDEAAERLADTVLAGQDLDAADALADAGCPEAALIRYRRHLQRHPDDASARYLAEALDGRIATDTNSDYVEHLYNEAASRFEERLLGHLDYQGPAWLDRHRDDLGQPDCIWDLGCGTGLAGERLASHWPNAALIGFDLSEGMLAQARHKQCYTALHHASLTDQAFLDRLAPEHRQPDLVLLMDVLIYLPDATAWLQALMNRLPSGCRVVLTLEQGAHERIQHQARIQHDGDTIRAALSPNLCRLDETAMIRLEKGEPVTGRWLVVEKA